MKRGITVQFLGLIIVNAMVNVAVVATTRQMAYHWSEALGDAALPRLTALVLNWGFVWPIVAALTSCLGFGLAVSSKWNEKKLQALFSILVLAELVCLSLHAYALVMPSLTITYRLSG